MLSITFNQKYGLIIEDNTIPKSHYLDLNIFNSQPYTSLYLIYKEGKNQTATMYVSIEGLTFNDIIYF